MTKCQAHTKDNTLRKTIARMEPVDKTALAHYTYKLKLCWLVLTSKHTTKTSTH